MIPSPKETTLAKSTGLVELGSEAWPAFHEIYPSMEALEDALQGSAAALPEQLEQLDELLSTLDG